MERAAAKAREERAVASPMARAMVGTGHMTVLSRGLILQRRPGVAFPCWPSPTGTGQAEKVAQPPTLPEKVAKQGKAVAERTPALNKLPVAELPME